MERIHKIIAHSGLCSRRAAEKLIEERRVTVDGHTVESLATTADPKRAVIRVDGRTIPVVTPAIYIFNKPKGVVSSTVRQGKEKIVTDFFPPNQKLYPVGRLDRDSEGLLLVTNNGDLSHKLTHPSFGHTKQYMVVVTWEEGAKKQEEDWIAKQLIKGVKLGDGEAKADKVDTKAFDEGKICLYITVHEGRHHLVRRMCARLGLEVRSLKRIKFATLKLDRLKPGDYRPLTEPEIKHLHEAETTA